MITQTMVKPDPWIETGIKITPVRNLYLFKFNENIQARLDELSFKKNNNIGKIADYLLHNREIVNRVDD